MKIISIGCKVLVIGCWCLLFGLVVGSYLPYNPYTPSSKTKLYVQVFIPEGWGFFTKDPREADPFIYSFDGVKWSSELRVPNGSFANLLGLRRNARAQGAEYGMLLSELTKDSAKWSLCKRSTHFECLNSHLDLSTYVVLNKVKRPTLCGDLWLIMQEPVPWAWYVQSGTVKMPIRFMRLNVLCDAKVPK